MRIGSRGNTRRSSPAMDAKPAYAKGIVRTPNKPRGKQLVDPPPPHESGAVRDFARNREPQDASRPDKGRAGRIRRGLDRGSGGTVAAPGGITDAARAEANGQRGALWGRLREIIENRFREQRGDPAGRDGGLTVPEWDPKRPIRTAGGRYDRPDIIRTPVRAPNTTSNPV